MAGIGPIRYQHSYQRIDPGDETAISIGKAPLADGGKLAVTGGADYFPLLALFQDAPGRQAALRLAAKTADGKSRAMWDIVVVPEQMQVQRGEGAVGVATASGTPPRHGATLLTILEDGRVGVLTTNPQAELDVNGVVSAHILQIAGGGATDLAETFVLNDDVAEPGTVLVIDEAHPGCLTISGKPYDRRVAGIVTGAGGCSSGVILSDGRGEGATIALAGRTYCKADASASPIEPGDLLTTSSVPGYAMKAVDESRARGSIVGKAMTALPEGQGLVLALVNLQ